MLLFPSAEPKKGVDDLMLSCHQKNHPNIVNQNQNREYRWKWDRTVAEYNISAFSRMCSLSSRVALFKNRLPLLYDLTFKSSYIIKAFQSWFKSIGFRYHGFPKPCLQKKAPIFTECDEQFKNSADAFHDRDENFVVLTCDQGSLAN